MIDKHNLADYEVVRQQGVDGHEKRTIAYRGDLFKVVFIKGNLTQYRIISLIFFLLMLILHLAAGFINNPGMGKFYIAIPYVFTYFPLFLLA